MNTEENLEKTIVTCGRNPDLDGFACVVAYQEFLEKTNQQASMAIFGDVHEEALYVLNRFGFDFPKNDFRVIKDSTKVVLLDASEVRSLDKSIKPERIIEIIDHRKENDATLFPNAKINIDFVGACATLVAEKFKEQKIIPSFQSSVLLYSAIVSNTLNFKASNATLRDKAIADWLDESNKLPESFSREMFLAKSDLSGDKLQERI